MKADKIMSLLYTVYSAGFCHGINEGPFPEHGTLSAFDRLIIGESPMQDNVSYDIKDKIIELLKLAENNEGS